MREEHWADIEGWEGIYQVSDKGRLKSFKKIKQGRILSNKNSKGHYLSVVLRYGEKKRYVRIHVLVAEAFVPNPYGYPEIDHIDGNKQKNWAENLEWVSHAENIRRSIQRNPSHVAGMNRHNQMKKTTPIVQKSLDGQVIALHTNGTDAARATGVCYKNILQVASKEEYKPGRIRKQAGGYKWDFLK